MKVSKLLITLSILCSSLVVADDTINSLEDYISENKKTIFDYEYQKVKADSSKLHDSWISPININYSYNKGSAYNDKTVIQNGSITIDQPIFQSGGIYFGIKYADALKKYSNYSIDVAKRKLVKDTVAVLMQIKQLALKINKQEFLIKNTEISLAQKKEQYINGQLDSGFLDQAIIDRNSIITSLYDLQTAKEKLISKFKSVSDMDYNDAIIPQLRIINKDSFLRNNIILKMMNKEIVKNRYNKNVTIAKYLPRIDLTGSYNWQKTENQKFNSTFSNPDVELDYYRYGFSANMPININTMVDIQSSKVDYLKSKISLNDKKRELLSLFEQVVQNISNYEKKIVLGKENQDIYEKLVAQTQELYKAGYKTKYDVELLSNSKTISELDVKIFELDKQLELLNLYEMYENDK